MWIGDFVRCHSVVKLLKARYPEPAGRRADHDAVRAAARLHAGRAQGHRLATCRAERLALRPAPGARRPAARRTLRHARWSCRGPGSRRWRRSSPAFRERTGFAGEVRFGLLNDMRFGETQTAAHDRPLRRAGAAEGRAPARGLAAARTRRAARRRPRNGARRRRLPDDGRPVVAFAPGAVGPSKRWPVDVFRRARAARSPPKASRSGCWAARPRRRSPPRSCAPPGPHARDLTSHRSAQRHPGAEARRRLRLERFRPRACRGRHRHADHRHLRADQPVALGAAQSARRRHRDADRRALPALPQADLPAACTTAACATSRPPRCCPPCIARSAG